MSERLHGKELAIAVAKKLGDHVDVYHDGVFTDEFISFDDYLKQKMADVLCMPGMRKKIINYFHFNTDMLSDEIVDWFCSDNFPEKVLNVFIQVRQ